ncbi:hypothetical protein C8R47DRAFT_594724 [Mycena vitilis]|nr:hypothetical protein C8R47DRAFT_594724 [Mycena vitilis]
MRAIQQTHPQTPPRLQEQFDVVLEAAGGLPASVFQLNTPRHPSQPGFEIYYGPLNFNVGLSPSAFDLNSEAVIRGEVLAEDLHDFDGHERGLDVAGARPDHSPRAQLQATELLKTLLTESAKAGEASPRSVSLALEDLMRTILDLSPPAVLRPEERSSTHIPMPRFSSHAPGHAARSSSLPPSPRTPVRGDLLESGFEYDVKKARMETPKNSGGGADGAALGTTRRLPFTPNNGRHAEN